MSSVVVLGGSLAGLTSAMLLARDGHHVTILERDDGPLPGDVDSAAGWARPTVPQTQQAHGVLALARSVLTRRLPDVRAALLAHGVGEYHLRDWIPPSAGGAASIDPTRTDDLVTIGCRRTTLEWVLRRCALEEPGIQVRTGVVASGLLWRPGRMPQVAGGLTRDHGEMPADVVLDAMGRRSNLTQWARAGGVELPERDEDCGFVAYTRFYRIRQPASMPRMMRGNANIAFLDGCGCYSFLADNDTAAVALGRLPQDAALAALRRPANFDAAAGAVPLLAPWVDPDRTEPISDVAVMGGLRNTVRPPLRDGRPQLLGLHAVGDALATTNPAYGRGVSLAFAHAEIVADGLAAAPDSPARQAELIGRRLADLTLPVWRDVVRHDRARTNAWRATLGLSPQQPPPPTSVSLPTAIAASMANADIWVRLHRGMQLLDQPDAVFDDEALAARIAELDPPPLPPFALRADLLRAMRGEAGRRVAVASSGRRAALATSVA